ncbi:MAG TPA: superinfection immunity protein [Bryobacteraceae bacterium]|nr:superinfection immunity protein [Bryobacteraceae bacterium]
MNPRTKLSPILLLSTELFGQTLRKRPPATNDSLLVMGGIVLIFLYFIPSFVAIARHKVNRNSIIAFNLFLGWSLFGWAIALVWALKVDEQPRY